MNLSVSGYDNTRSYFHLATTIDGDAIRVTGDGDIKIWARGDDEDSNPVEVTLTGTTTVLEWLRRAVEEALHARLT